MNSLPKIRDEHCNEYEHYLFIAKRYAKKFSSRSFHSAELREELFSIGTIAFLEAYERYKDLSEVHRIRALSLRIRGAMLDYLQKLTKEPLRATLRFEASDVPSSRRDSNPEYQHILSEIRKKLERGYNDLTHQECFILKSFLSGEITEEIRTLSASNRTKIKQKAFKTLRKYLSHHYSQKELLLLLAE
jgi:hypothetical protein